MSEIVRAWAIQGPVGLELHATAKPTEDAAWNWLRHLHGPRSIEVFQKMGYRAVQVEIRKVEDGK